MRVLGTADWHIRTDNPRCRNDEDYVAVQYAKSRWVLKTGLDLEVDAVLIAGDIFDKARVPRWLSNMYLDLFRKFQRVGLRVVVCAGQHDQINHTKDLSNTSIGSLISSGVVYHGSTQEYQACDWGCDIDSVADRILVLHDTVVEHPGSIIKNAICVDDVFDKFKNKWIVSGDNHTPFIVQKNARTLINCGSLMRQSKDQYDYKPAVWLLDTEKIDIRQNYKVERIPIPIKPSEEVFDLNLMDKDEDKAETKGKIEAFIEALKEDHEEAIFDDNVDFVIEEYKPSVNIIKIMSRTMENAERID